MMASDGIAYLAGCDDASPSPLPLDASVRHRRPSLSLKILDHKAHQSRPSYGTIATPRSVLTPPLTPLTSFSSGQSSVVYEPEQFPNFLRAFYHYHPDGPISDDDQLSVTLPIDEGDVILVHSIQPNGWADGTLLSNGSRGWLPTNYCATYEPAVMRPLLVALTNVWEFLRGHEEDDCSALASQDYVRGVIAGVRRLLQQSGCLSRDSEPVSQQQGIRLLRKALLSDLSGFAKKAKAVQESCQNRPDDRDTLCVLLDEVLLKAFKVMTRAVRFLDLWHQAWHMKQGVGREEEDLPVASTTVPSPAARDTCSQPHEPESVRPRGDCVGLAQLENASRPHTAPVREPSPVSLDDSPPSSQNQNPNHDGRREQLARDLRNSPHLDDLSRATQADAAEPSASLQIPPSPPPFAKRASASHRLSHALKSPTTPDHVLASDQLNASHEAFLSLIGAFIGLHLHSRPLMELLNTTKQSIAACDALLRVVEEVWEQDYRRSEAVDASRAVMHMRLADLVNVTREIFLLSQANGDEDVRLPEQTDRLVDAATACVRSAGDCVSKSRAAIERSGDFEMRRPDAFQAGTAATGSSHTTKQQQQQTQTPSRLNEHNAHLQSIKAPPRTSSHQSSQPAASKPLPATPPRHSRSTHAQEPSLPSASRPSPPRSTSAQSSQSDVTMQLPTVSALRAKSQFLKQPSISRRASETGLRKAGARASRITGSGSNLPTLQVDIPHGSFFDASITPTRPTHASPETTTTTTTTTHQAAAETSEGSPDSVGGPQSAEAPSYGLNSADGSVADSAESKSNGYRSSGDSGGSHASTRATTPDQYTSGDLTQSPSSAASDNARQDTSDNKDAESQLLSETFAHELVFNREGQVTGGSVPALVERLTAHDTTPDALFVNTFYLTFRLFTTPSLLAQTLVDRFEKAGDDHATGMPVRLRVYNVLKGWMESHWNAEADADALRTILGFANGRLRFDLPSASRRLLELALQVSDMQGQAKAPKPALASLTRPRALSGVNPSPDATAPAPIVSKGQLNMLKTLKNGVSACTILDLDPLELARQLTIMQSKIFCAIQPEELLSLEWTKKQDSRAVNVRAMSTLSTDLANLVADTILQFEVKRRAVMIKRWVKIGSKCLDLGNYDALMAIVCALNSSVVQRLKKTWDHVSLKAIDRLHHLNIIVDHARNHTVLRQRLHSQVAPCLPFVGLYLTDLTFVDAGNSSTRQLPGGRESQTVINFDKYVKTTRIIGDIQRFQVPYKLTAIPEMQDWMESQIVKVRDVEQSNVQNYYRRSLMLEPRDGPVSKQSPTDSAGGSFGSQQSKESGHGNKFDFLTGISLSLNKEKPSN